MKYRLLNLRHPMTSDFIALYDQSPCTKVSSLVNNLYNNSNIIEISSIEAIDDGEWDELIITVAV